MGFDNDNDNESINFLNIFNINHFEIKWMIVNSSLALFLHSAKAELLSAVALSGHMTLEHRSERSDIWDMGTQVESPGNPTWGPGNQGGLHPGSQEDSRRANQSIQTIIIIQMII